MQNRAFGYYGFAYWTLIACNVLLPQTLWFRKMRLNVGWLFALSLIVQLGMWTERVVIVVQSLHRDYLPSSWHIYFPTGWDWATLAGTIGLFFGLFFLFIRLLPIISIHEEQALEHEVETPRSSEGESAGKPTP